MPSQKKHTNKPDWQQHFFFTVTVVSSLLLAILTMACFLKTQGLPLRIPFVKGLVAINLTVQSFHFAAGKKTSDWSLGSLLSRVWQQPTSLYKTFLEKNSNANGVLLSKTTFCTNSFCQRMLFGFCLLSRHLCTNSFCQRMLFWVEPFIKASLYKFFLSKNASGVLPFVKASLHKFFLSKNASETFCQGFCPFVKGSNSSIAIVGQKGIHCHVQGGPSMLGVLGDLVHLHASCLCLQADRLVVVEYHLHIPAFADGHLP